MLDVIIALAPATLFGVIIFGFSALLTIAVSVAAAVLLEKGYDVLGTTLLSTKVTPLNGL